MNALIIIAALLIFILIPAWLPKLIDTVSYHLQQKQRERDKIRNAYTNALYSKDRLEVRNAIVLYGKQMPKEVKIELEKRLDDQVIGLFDGDNSK